MIYIGLAISAHTFIALHSGILKNWDSFIKKIALAVIIAICISMLYNTLPRILLPKLNLVYSTMTIPDYKIKERDSLLAWNSPASNTELLRGSLVIIPAGQLTNYGNGIVTRNGIDIMGEIIATGGENIEIKNDFMVNGIALNQNQFPVPNWLKGKEFAITIPEDCYFVAVVYNINIHGMQFDSSYINQLCVVKKSDIKAKVFMRWQPLWTRGILKVN